MHSLYCSYTLITKGIIPKSDDAQDKVPTNKMMTIIASHGNWNIDMAEAFCSSPPAPTPVNRKVTTLWGTDD